jgi:hypothetical protein
MKSDRRGQAGRAWRQTSAHVNVEGPQHNRFVRATSCRNASSSRTPSNRVGLYQGFTPPVCRSDGLRRERSSEKIDGRP